MNTKEKILMDINKNDLIENKKEIAIILYV